MSKHDFKNLRWNKHRNSQRQTWIITKLSVYVNEGLYIPFFSVITWFWSSFMAYLRINICIMLYCYACLIDWNLQFTKLTKLLQKTLKKRAWAIREWRIENLCQSIFSLIINNFFFQNIGHVTISKILMVSFFNDLLKVLCNLQSEKIWVFFIKFFA